MNKRERVGFCGVDAGLIWIGDPCYILHKYKNAEKDYDKPPKSIGDDWPDFCGKFEGPVTKFDFDLGHEGLGICISDFGGDGCYPVYITRNEKGRVVKAEIVFDDEV